MAVQCDKALNRLSQILFEETSDSCSLDNRFSPPETVRRVANWTGCNLDVQNDAQQVVAQEYLRIVHLLEASSRYEVVVVTAARFITAWWLRRSNV